MNLLFAVKRLVWSTDTQDAVLSTGASQPIILAVIVNTQRMDHSTHEKQPDVSASTAQLMVNVSLHNLKAKESV